MKKILCIDSYRSLLKLYEEELAEEGCEVILARDVAEALEKIDQENPSLVVTEMLQPSGVIIPMIGDLLPNDRRVPVILNTTNPQYCPKYGGWRIEACTGKSSDFIYSKEKIRDILEKMGKGDRKKSQEG